MFCDVTRETYLWKKQYPALSYSILNFKPVHCSMSGSNYCFLTCIQVSQEAGKVVWYSRLCNNFPQFVVICTVKGFSIVNEAEVFFFFSEKHALLLH